MMAEAWAGLLALALQGSPVAPPIPVVVYPVLDHGKDALMADRLTRALANAFRRDTGLTILDRRLAAGSRANRAAYGVLADLNPTSGGSVRLHVRAVAIESVYLVAFDSVIGSPAAVERALPALAAKVALRLKTLQAAPFAAARPPSWRVPTEALRAYARALGHADEGDTARAVRLLREALRIFPKYDDACRALRRFAADTSCAR